MKTQILDDTNYFRVQHLFPQEYNGFSSFGKMIFFLRKHDGEVQPAYLHFIKGFTRALKGAEKCVSGARHCYFSSFYTSNTMQ